MEGDCYIRRRKLVRGIGERIHAKRINSVKRAGTEAQSPEQIEAAFGKRRRVRRAKTALVLTALALLLTVVIANELIFAPLAELAVQQARRLASEALSDAILEVMAEYASSGGTADFTRQELASDGMGLLYIDSAQMGLMAARITERAQQRMRSLAGTEVGVPLGSVSGIVLLNGSGPRLSAALEPLGNVSGRFSSKFEAAGVNQTRYAASIELAASVKLILAGRTLTVEASANAPVLETVVIGKAPQAYTDVSSFEDALNLIPTEAGGE